MEIICLTYDNLPKSSPFNPSEIASEQPARINTSRRALPFPSIRIVFFLSLVVANNLQINIMNSIQVTNGVGAPFQFDVTRSIQTFFSIKCC